MSDELKREASELTELLAGKTVKVARRLRECELLLEFTDGTRLFIDRGQTTLEFSVTES